MRLFFRLCFLLLTCCGVSCSNQAQTPAEVNADAFEAGARAAGVQLLDVRTAGEFSTGHLAGALQANYNDDKQFKERIAALDKTRPVYIYCLSGGRSAAAAEWMRSNGYSNVVELKGGINAWKKAGKQVEGKPDRPQMNNEQYLAQLQSDKLVLVDFGAAWCPPCKKMEPVIEQFTADQAKAVKLVKVDGGVDTDLMKQYQVEALPVFILYKAGREVWRKQGICSLDELNKAVADHR
jgi:thioredoxin